MAALVSCVSTKPVKVSVVHEATSQFEVSTIKAIAEIESLSKLGID